MTPLERYRKAAGLTMKEFAEAVGVTVQSIIAWEKGRSQPAPKMYGRIAKVLGITPLEVTELVSPSPTPVGVMPAAPVPA